MPGLGAQPVSNQLLVGISRLESRYRITRHDASFKNHNGWVVNRGSCGDQIIPEHLDGNVAGITPAPCRTLV
jgi:hypothetical protein